MNTEAEPCWMHVVPRSVAAGWDEEAHSMSEQGTVFATLLTTARRRGQNAHGRLCAIVGLSPPRAADMVT